VKYSSTKFRKSKTCCL